MKFLKFLLVLFLMFLVVVTGGVIFSDKIVYNMTKTKNSEFKNLKYSIKDNEITFDNFLLNGRELGKGKAKISFTRKGFLGLNLKSSLSEMKLENVDLKQIYDAPNNQIDFFVKKIDIPADNKTIEKTTEEFVKETTEELGRVSLNTDNFINVKIRNNILNTNKIKADYNSSTDLKNKSQKIMELDREVKSITEMINTEKQNIENSISKIEVERNLMLKNVSQELNKLEKTISLNDINNINSYIFMDNGENIVQSLNKTLKIVNLIKEIKEAPITISDIDINNGTVKINGLDGKNSVSGEIKLEDIPGKITVKSLDEGYGIDYNQDKLTIHTSYNKKIISVIEYVKDSILEGKSIKLVSRLISENDNFQNISETTLSDEEKTLLIEKIKNLEQTRYQEIMTKYDEQTKNIENLIKTVYDRKAGLEQIQRELISLNTMINLPETSGTSVSTESPLSSETPEVNKATDSLNTQNTQSENQQQRNNKNTLNDAAEKLKEIFEKKDNKKEKVIIMRLDKFLKITRIIKRRTVAKELADNGNISINGEEKKSSYNVKKGDILDIKYFNKNIKVRIKELPPENLKKDFIDEYIEIIN